MIVHMSVSQLRRALRVVTPFVSPDFARPNINSMLVETSGAGIRLVATDGHRMAVYEIPGTTLDTDDDGSRVRVAKGCYCDCAPGGPPSALFALAPLLATLKSLPKGRGGKVPGHATIDLATGEVTIRETGTGTTVATWARTDATFPAWEQVMPQGHAPGGVSAVSFASGYIVDACAAVDAAWDHGAGGGSERVSPWFTFEVWEVGMDPVRIVSPEVGLTIVQMPMRTHLSEAADARRAAALAAGRGKEGLRRVG